MPGTATTALAAPPAALAASFAAPVAWPPKFPQRVLGLLIPDPIASAELPIQPPSASRKPGREPDDGVSAGPGAAGGCAGDCTCWACQDTEKRSNPPINKTANKRAPFAAVVAWKPMAMCRRSNKGICLAPARATSGYGSNAWTRSRNVETGFREGSCPSKSHLRVVPSRTGCRRGKWPK